MKRRAIVLFCLVFSLLIGCAAFPRHPDRKPTIWEVITAYIHPQQPTVTPKAVAALPPAGSTATIGASTPVTGTTTLPATSVITSTVPISGSIPLTDSVPIGGRENITGTATPKGTTSRGQTPISTSVSTRTGTASAPTAAATPTPRTTTTPRPTTRGTPTQGATRGATPTRRVEPTPDETATLPPSPPEDPIREAIYIRSHVGQAENGRYVVVGEVVNGENYPIYGAKVVGTFVDSSGNVVGAQEALTIFPKTEVEESNPFRLSVSDPGGQVASYELTLLWEEISIVEFLAVDVVSAELNDEEGLEVTGELHNGQGTDLTSIIVSITFYNESGEVVDVYDQFYGAQVLKPDESMPYSIEIAKPDLEYDTFRVQAQGNVNLF